MKITTDISILRAKNEPVLINEVPHLISSLEKGLNFSALSGKPGIGLACPQININKRAAIIRINQGNSKYSLNLCNAKISGTYDPFIFENEACLSIENRQGSTIRYREIYVSNNLVEPRDFVATGLLAIAIQHEIDHLNGILFIDRISNNKPNDPCPCGKGLKYKKCCGGSK